MVGCMVCLRRTSQPLLVPLLGRALCSSLTESCPGAVSLPLIEEAPPGKRRPSYSVASSSSPLFAHYALVGERPGCIQLICNKTQLARRQRRHNQGEAQEGVINPQQTPNRAWGRGGTSRQTKRAESAIAGVSKAIKVTHTSLQSRTYCHTHAPCIK